MDLKKHYIVFNNCIDFFIVSVNSATFENLKHQVLYIEELPQFINIENLALYDIYFNLYNKNVQYKLKQIYVGTTIIGKID